MKQATKKKPFKKKLAKKPAKKPANKPKRGSSTNRKHISKIHKADSQTSPALSAQPQPPVINECNEFEEALLQVGDLLDSQMREQSALVDADPLNPGVGIARPSLDQECEALIKKYREIRNCEEVLENFKSQAKSLENSIIATMTAQNLRGIKLKSGQQFNLMESNLWRMPTLKEDPELRQQAIDWIVDHGGADLVSSTIHFKAAESFINQLAEGIEGVAPPIEIPEHLFKKTVMKTLQVPGKRSLVANPKD